MAKKDVLCTCGKNHRKKVIVKTSGYSNVTFNTCNTRLRLTWGNDGTYVARNRLK